MQVIKSAPCVLRGESFAPRLESAQTKERDFSVIYTCRRGRGPFLTLKRSRSALILTLLIRRLNRQVRAVPTAAHSLSTRLDEVRHEDAVQVGLAEVVAAHIARVQVRHGAGVLQRQVQRVERQHPGDGRLALPAGGATPARWRGVAAAGRRVPLVAVVARRALVLAGRVLVVVTAAAAVLVVRDERVAAAAGRRHR